MFPWGIIPYCEISHDGIKMVFFKMREVFQMFKVTKESWPCQLLTNLNLRSIHLVVDALFSWNFRCSTLNLLKKLTELGSALLILPLIHILQRFTPYTTICTRPECIAKMQFTNRIIDPSCRHPNMSYNRSASLANRQTRI